MTASFSGRVVAVAPNRIDISDPAGSIYRLRVDSNTRVLREGHRVSTKALRSGMPVRASLALIEPGDERARTIEIQRTAMPLPPNESPR